MLTTLIITVVILILAAVGVYFWLSSRKYSTLVSLMNRLKDDTSNPFEECGDINAHLKLLKKELDQLLKNSKNKDKTREQIEEVLKSRVDPKIQGGTMERWIESKLQMITARIGCIREIQNDFQSEYISVKKHLEKNMANIRPIMKTNFKSCDEFLKMHADLNSAMTENMLKDRTHQRQLLKLMQHRMRTESVDEEYPNPLGKDEDLGQYISNLHSKTCSA
jgi:chromosome segregation ATPase